MALELSSKDVIVVGAPSVMSVWGFDLVRAAAELAHAEIRYVDRLDEVEEVPVSPDRARVFCLSQYPSAGLLDIIRDARVPVIAFLDQPIDAVRFLKKAANCTFIEALRAQTAAATVYAALRDNPAVVLISRSEGALACRVVAQILDQLGLTTTEFAREAFIAKFLGEGAAKLPLESALSRRVFGYEKLGKTSALSSEETTVIGQVLTPMMRAAFRSDIGPICWPSSVFLHGDRPNERAPLVAELTGAARIIYYGPYFHLQAGRWQVRPILGFSHDIFGTPLWIEVYGSELIATALIKPKDEGIFQVSFSLVHHKPQDPLQFRIRSDESAIEGRIGLSRVHLIPEAL